MICVGIELLLLCFLPVGVGAPTPTLLTLEAFESGSMLACQYPPVSNSRLLAIFSITRMKQQGTRVRSEGKKAPSTEAGNSRHTP